MTKRDLQNLFELLEHGENQYCADCREKDPQWASVNIGVFICVNCSGIHRMLGVHISRVRSLRLDQWPEETVTYMSEKGNENVNTELERSIPPYYSKPNSSDPQVYREHFIHAKYERKEFAQPGGPTHYEEPLKEGILYKRGKKDKSFRPRLFILNTNEGTLKYFVKVDGKDPKHVIQLSRMHVFLAPDKINHSNGMQVSFSTVGNRSYRHIYLYCEDPKEAVDWYISLRAAAYNVIKTEQPELVVEDILCLLDRQHVKQGYMYKTGPKKTEPFRKRWFSLESRSLIYFLSPLDAYPKGEIYIGNANDGYSVEESWGSRKEENGHGILLHTPEREFLMYCEDREEHTSWISEINNVLSRPMSAKELAEFDVYNTDRKLGKRRGTWMKRS